MSTLKNTSILCSALTCALPAAEVAGATPNEQRPNIIFILADDLGYMDVCSFAHRVTGTPIDSMFFETPHIDRLVEGGYGFFECLCVSVELADAFESVDGKVCGSAWVYDRHAGPGYVVHAE